MAYKITENSVNNMIPDEQDVGDAEEEKLHFARGHEADI